MSVRKEYDNRSFALTDTGVLRAIYVDGATDSTSGIIAAIENPEERDAKIIFAALSYAAGGADQELSAGTANTAIIQGTNLFNNVNNTSAGTSYTRDANAGEMVTLSKKGNATGSFITVGDTAANAKDKKVGLTVLLAYDY